LLALSGARAISCQRGTASRRLRFAEEINFGMRTVRATIIGRLNRADHVGLAAHLAMCSEASQAVGPTLRGHHRETQLCQQDLGYVLHHRVHRRILHRC